MKRIVIVIFPFVLFVNEKALYICFVLKVLRRLKMWNKKETRDGWAGFEWMVVLDVFRSMKWREQPWAKKLFCAWHSLLIMELIWISFTKFFVICLWCICCFLCKIDSCFWYNSTFEIAFRLPVNQRNKYIAFYKEFYEEGELLGISSMIIRTKRNYLENENTHLCNIGKNMAYGHGLQSSPETFGRFVECPWNMTTMNICKYLNSSSRFNW